jgi:hypothetical protein
MIVEVRPDRLKGINSARCTRSMLPSRLVHLASFRFLYSANRSHSRQHGAFRFVVGALSGLQAFLRIPDVIFGWSACGCSASTGESNRSERNRRHD